MVTAIMAALSAAASVAGGIAKTASARRAARRQQRELDAMKAENDAWYNRNYYADATQRADNQRALTQARETLRRNNVAAAGRAAVMGGTNAEAAAVKEANNMAYADAVSQVAANAQQYKDRVDFAHRNNEIAEHKQQMQVDAARDAANAAAIDAAAQGTKAVGEAFVAGSDLGKGKTETPTNEQIIGHSNAMETGEQLNKTPITPIGGNNAPVANAGQLQGNIMNQKKMSLGDMIKGYMYK